MSLRHVLPCVPFVMLLAAASCTPARTQPTLKGYLTSFSAVAEEAQRREDEVDFPFDSPFDVDESRLDEAHDYVRAMSENLEKEHADLLRLSPPASVRAAHDNFIAAHQSVVDRWVILEESTTDLQSASQFNTILVRYFEAELVIDDVGNACRELQNIGNEQGLSIDLGCGSAES